MPIAHDLDLDVMAVLDVRLDEDATIAERGLGLACRRLDGRGELGFVAHDAHPPAATACGRLHEHRHRETRSAPRPVRRRGSAWSGRPLRSPPSSPPPCRRAGRSDRGSARPRSTRRRSPTVRTPRSRRGSRSRGGPRRIRCRARPAGQHPHGGTTRPGSTHRAPRRGRPSRRATRCGRARRTRRPSRCPSRGRSTRSARRSRRGWR